MPATSTEQTHQQRRAVYQVFTREVDQVAPGVPGPYPDNDASAWTPVGSVVPLGSPATASLTCSGSPTVDKYVTAGMVFDSAYGNVLLSGNSTRLECGSNLADPDVDIERKPRNREKPRSRSRGR